MKRFVVLIILSLIFSLTGCGTDEEFNGLSLPFPQDDIESVRLIHHKGDPSQAQQKLITEIEDISYIYNMLSKEILIKDGTVVGAAQTDSLRITFCFKDGSGYTVRFYSYGVKKGLISSEDSPAFTYFTSADVCWIWAQLAKDYEAENIAIVDHEYATECPSAIVYETE